MFGFRDGHFASLLCAATPGVEQTNCLVLACDRVRAVHRLQRLPAKPALGKPASRRHAQATRSAPDPAHRRHLSAAAILRASALGAFLTARAVVLK